MDIKAIDEVFHRYFDKHYLVQTLTELAKVPTEVPLGYDTFMDPDHAKLVHYVQDIIQPKIKELGYHVSAAPRNNLIVPVGKGELSDSLIIQNYTVTQHFNLMENAFSGDLISGKQFGVDGDIVLGQGVSQNKSHQAVMLAILKLLMDAEITISGKLYWTVNNEGNSSHLCTEMILAEIGDTPSFGILQINTGMKLWLGNRGRVDVNVHVKGTATHSSSPDLGLSAIEGANQVINHLKKLNWEDAHALLGARHAVVYKIRYEPLAPHTLPSDAYMAIDRRLIPGDEIDLAVEEVREVLSDIEQYEITIEKGFHMLPALVDPNIRGVKILKQSHSVVFDEPVEIVYGGGAFDAGGLTTRGIPTVMYGAAGGDGLLGTDYIAINDVINEARVIFQFIMSYLSKE